MPTTNTTPVNKLALDLYNFRTVPQSDELHAIQAMIAVKSDWFWALTESLIDDGYLPIENILVLRQNDSTLLVKEGNRRIAALKLIHGYLPVDSIVISSSIREKITNISPEWKRANKSVPCTIYEIEEAETVDRIVTRAHGKGEKAGRDQWNAVAHARHNRDVNKVNEPGLDLLEKYLKVGQNITAMEANHWAGVYPLSVLSEAIKRIAPRIGVKNAPELAKNYPSIQYRDAVEKLLKDIGTEFVGFDTIRNKSVDFVTLYGIPPTTSSTASATKKAQSQSTTSKASTNKTSASGQAGKRAVAAVATHDPRAVKRTLKQFFPVGNNRQKIVALRDETLKLDLNKTPLAFCFLLRSMFEISAKVYCDDHKANNGPSAIDANGKDRKLVDILRGVTKHLTASQTGKQDQAMTRALHGAMVELAKPEGILSVTSMNQLIHNPKFSLAPSDISTTFGNIFPLLEAMNI